MRVTLISLTLMVLIFTACPITAAPAAEPAQSLNTVLVVLTNVAKVPGTERETGFWAEEFVVPCEIFKKAGFKIITASLDGGIPHADSASLNPEMVGKQQAGHFSDFLAKNKELMTTVALKDVKLEDFSAIFIVGGHGVMWDLSKSKLMHDLAARTLAEKKVLSAVCHGPGAIVNACGPGGEFILKGRKVTGFSNAEEKAGKMDKVVPYSLEDALQKNSGGFYTAGELWKSHVVIDGNLITGQNPGSSAETADAVVKAVLSKASDASGK